MSLDVVMLHQMMVAIRSVSGEEQAIADFVERLLNESPVAVQRVGNSVIATVGEGPTLVLNSHLDTVPPQEGWTSDPFAAVQSGDMIIGLGANDAKGSVASLITAFLDAAGRSLKCRLVLMLVEGEETLGIGTTNCLQELLKQGVSVDAAVIGEPTDLSAGVAQFGLAIFNLVARGTACHAAHAKALGLTNPVVQLAQDIAAIADLDLGETTLQPTVLQGASAKNQVPEIATATFDARLAPPTQAEDVLSSIQAVVKSDVEVHSQRLRSYAMPGESPFLQCLPEEQFVSRTMSDQVFFQGIPAVKLGPGQTERSHTADEFILISELHAGVAAYSHLIQRFEEVYA